MISERKIQSGTYRYEQIKYDRIIGHITINVKDTEKAYNFELLEDTTRYDYPQFVMMFENSNRVNKVRIKKQGSGHAIRIWNNGFTIYPFQGGVPFNFQKVESDV